MPKINPETSDTDKSRGVYLLPDMQIEASFSKFSTTSVFVRLALLVTSGNGGFLLKDPCTPMCKLKTDHCSQVLSDSFQVVELGP